MTTSARPVAARQNVDVPAPGPRLLAVASGKGGAGASVVAAGLAVSLLRAGQRVLLVDANLGGANLHTYLGIAPPPLGLGDLVHESNVPLERVVVETPLMGLSLVAGARDPVDMAQLSGSRRRRLLRELLRSEASWVVLDAGCGSGHNTVDLLLMADQRVVVTTPTPASVERVWRLLRALCVRHLLGHVTRRKHRLEEAVEQRPVRDPAEVLEAVGRTDPALAREMADDLAQLTVALAVNLAVDPDDATLPGDMAVAGTRRLGLALSDVATVPEDGVLRAACRRRELLALDPALSPALTALAPAVRLLMRARMTDAAGRAAGRRGTSPGGGPGGAPQRDLPLDPH